MATSTSKFISINSPIEEWIAKVGIFFVVWISPLALKIGIVTAFITLDTIMGVVAAYKSGEEVSSRKLRQGFIPKAIGYATMVAATYLIDTEVYNINASFLAVMFVAFAEMKSMDENFKKITGYSIWSKIIEPKNKK